MKFLPQETRKTNPQMQLSTKWEPGSAPGLREKRRCVRSLPTQSDFSEVERAWGWRWEGGLPPDRSIRGGPFECPREVLLTKKGGTQSPPHTLQ